MSKIQKHHLLALSVAALVASSVAALAGVTTFKNDLTGKAVYLAQEGCPGGCPMGQWCDYATHACKSDSYSGGGSSEGSAYHSAGTAGTSTTTTSTTTSTSGPTGLNCAGGSLAACQATCTKDGVVNSFCKGYCAQECPTTSTTTATSTTATVTNRCAYVTEKDGCMTKCTCYVENTGSCSSPKADEAAFCNAVKGADATKTGKTGVFTMTTCSNYCDELKAAPPAPVVETPVPVPVSTAPAVTVDHAAAPVIEERRDFRNFEDGGFEGDGGDFDGGSEDFGEFDDFSDGFHGGPGDDFGFPMEDFGHFGDMYDMEFDPGMMQEGFDEYFSGFGPGMGGEFGGDYGGGFGGDFGGGPDWMRDELEDTKDMMRSMAEHMCPDFVEEIDDVEDFDGLEELGFLMQEECGGGGPGEGGPPDPEMMANAAKMLQIFADKDGPVYHALDVAQRHNVFTTGEVREINDILAQLGEKAKEAEALCMDLPELPDMDMMGGEEEDFFGFKGLLAQLFDDEEEGDDEEFEDDDEEGSTFDGEMPEEFRAYEECGKVLDVALGAGPGQDEEEIGSGLMGELEEAMREPMEAAVADGTIPQEEWDEVESRFEEVMADLGFEEEFDESFQEEEGFREVDEGEWEMEEGGTDEEEGDFEDVDF